ncbi:hypothetical protein KSC_102500 [Ktedonobacter sp. SOSP1-52]|nr:hypothetical protein KSC_102500 [Ktedonobacter sp. SOSP1-52]
MQSWGGGARGVVTGARLVIIVEVSCGMLAGAVAVMCGLPDASVEVAFGMPVLGEEQLMNSSAISKQAQHVEKRDESPAR